MTGDGRFEGERAEMDYRQQGLDGVPRGTTSRVYAAIAAVGLMLLAASVLA